MTFFVWKPKKACKNQKERNAHGRPKNKTQK